MSKKNVAKPNPLLDLALDYHKRQLRLAKLIKSGLGSEANLKSGRIAGARARKQKSDDKLKILEKAVSDLFKSGQKMSNPEITDFLLARKLSFYSRESTLAHVKRIAAKLRK